MEDSIHRAMMPTEAVISALPLTSHARIVAGVLAGVGTRALDIGCGEGKFTRGLTDLFVQVSGVDVKTTKIADAKEAAAAAGLTVDFRVGSGEQLPYPDESFDTVVFSNSLHHMPNPAAALREAMRVLRPGGLLYVMEPVPAGNYHNATRLVNDEMEVRTLAYRELIRLPGAEHLRELMYRRRRVFADFEEWRANQIDRDVRRKAHFDARNEEVRREFEAHATHEDGRLVFNQAFRVDVLRKT